MRIVIVRTCYNDIIAVVRGHICLLVWNREEPNFLDKRVNGLKRKSLQMFNENYNRSLYDLNYLLLYDMIEDIQLS